MVRLNARRLATIRTLALVGLLAIGLAAATALALGQAHTAFTFTGAMHSRRANHSATLNEAVAQRSRSSSRPCRYQARYTPQCMVSTTPARSWDRIGTKTM
jgi:hypothetical protein